MTPELEDEDDSVQIRWRDPTEGSTSPTGVKVTVNEGSGYGEYQREYRVAIVGSRGFPQLEAPREFVCDLKEEYDEEPTVRLVIVTGCARGVDAAVRGEAQRLGLPLEVYEANWNEHGKAAGVIRNTKIVKNCHDLYAFWDGESPGTLDAIEKAVLYDKFWGVEAPDHELHQKAIEKVKLIGDGYDNRAEADSQLTWEEIQKQLGEQ